MIAELVGVVAGGYLLLVGGMVCFQRDMIYHPGRHVPDPAEVGLPEMVPVPVRAADGWVVTGWYAPPSDGRAPTIVLFHGNGGTLAARARKARAFLDAGYGVYLAEYRGYGGNAGRPTEAGLYADARAVLQWLTTRGIPESRLVLYGESLGSGVATQIAAERPDLVAVVLEAPFTRLPDLAPPYLLPGLAELLMVDKYDNAAKIAQVAAPLLIIHGDRDETVPPAMGRALLHSARTKTHGVFLPDAGHNDVWDHGGGEAVLEWLANLRR